MKNLIRCCSLIALLSANAYGQTTVFNYTGAVQYYTVPPCVTALNITCEGAQGGGTPNNGNGDVVIGTIAVTPGQILEVYVGGQGICPPNGATALGGAGWNGGGNGWASANAAVTSSCGGGGASDVRIAPYGLANRVIVAAGGGGRNGWSGVTNIGNGGTTGCTGGNTGGSPFGGGGLGGTQIAGGGGGFGWAGIGLPGAAGASGQGGDGGQGISCNAHGGGGGGGYFGGGGGGGDGCCDGANGGGGGGGGSSFTPGGGVCTANTNTGDGQVTITATGGGLIVNFTPAAPTICVGQSVQIVASGTSVSYNWLPSSSLNTTTGNTVIATPAATETFQVIVTNGGACTDTVPVTVTVNPNPVVSVNPSSASICSGGSVPIAASGATTYSWSPAAGLSATTGPNVTASPTGTQTYTVTGTTAGCSATATTTITVNPNPTININPAASMVCPGQSVTLTASGATSYSWSPTTGLSSGTGSTVTATPPSTQTYTVTGTDAFGCTASQTTTVTVNPLPTVNAGADQNVCLGFGTGLSGTAGAGTTVAWTPATGLNNPAILTPTASPTSTTVYTLTVTDGNGCTNTDQVTVTVNNVTAGFTATPQIGEPPLNVTFTNTSTGNPVGYNWNYGDGATENTTNVTITHTYNTAGNYVVTLISTDAFGCVDTAYITIVVEFPFSLLIPNVFSPNGDANNEVFEVVHEGVKDINVKIFDRWGLEMYSYSDLNGSWDGTRGGADCPSGTYFYVIILTTKTDETKEYNGAVTLLR